ncbi:hypothetical protein BKA70DRAFT_1226135 [Coprinopsis sp. MPI-PUGE-AT-0042]|nr:hypothetical protein BKA70DRAFT_1226135 [Coprinopsis sp. MPI-PUGE-AT-0042]
MDPPRKPGMRERFKGGLKEGKQWLKGHLSSRPASPLPSGTSTPQVVETEHDLPSNEQATELPPLTSHVAEAHPHPIPNDLKNDPPAGPLPELTLSGVDSNTAKVEVPEGLTTTNEGPPATPLPNQIPSGFDKFKDYANVTGSLLQLVLKKVPDAVDSNPVKVFFSLAKTVLELKAGMDDNKDAVEQHMVTISRLLLTVEAAQIDWTGVDASEEKQAMDLFQKEAGEQLEELVKIKNQSRHESNSW